MGLNPIYIIVMILKKARLATEELVLKIFADTGYGFRRVAKQMRRCYGVRLFKYQFTAIDIRTSIRFLAYGQQKSFSNGWAFMVLVMLWIRCLYCTIPTSNFR